MRRIVLLLLVVATVALAVNTVVTDRRTEPAEADVGRILELPGADLQVRERGPHGAPEVVLLHCYTCSIHWWARLESLLASRYRVVSIDLPGHGGSEKPRDGYRVDEQAAAVAAALRELGGRKALVVGQSLGGVIGTALAERDPELVRGLVLMDSPVRVKYKDLPLVQRLSVAPVIGQAGWRLATDGMVREGLSDAFVSGYEIPDRFVQDVQRMTFTSFRDAPEDVDRYIEERPLDDRLAALDIPALVIYGAEDEVVKPPSEAAGEFRDVPGARVVVLPGVGHTPQVEAPGKSAALIRAFDRRTRR